MCELNGDVSFLSFFLNFCCFVLFFFFKKFYFVSFTFLVTKTKIRNRKAVFQADSQLRVVEAVHGRLGIIVSVRSSESV